MAISTTNGPKSGGSTQGSILVAMLNLNQSSTCSMVVGISDAVGLPLRSFLWEPLLSGLCTKFSMGNFTLGCNQSKA